MSGFDAHWLDLREAADLRARSRDVADALSGYFALRSSLSVIDLGCGTGANLRATAPLLPDQQSWRLIDNDAALLDLARSKLETWADRSTDDGQALRLWRGHQVIDVRFEVHDLASNLDAVSTDNVDLLTASAFFDLTSEPFMRSLIRKLQDSESAFHTVLTYNGVQRWQPHRPHDNLLVSAINRHQMRDKGFGPAAGPTAATCLADQLKMNDFTVCEGDSPWQLSSRNDDALIKELMRGTAQAAAEATPSGEQPDAKTIAAWLAQPRTAAIIGHVDIFAAPRKGGSRGLD